MHYTITKTYIVSFKFLIEKINGWGEEVQEFEMVTFSVLNGTTTIGPFDYGSLFHVAADDAAGSSLQDMDILSIKFMSSPMRVLVASHKHVWLDAGHHVPFVVKIGLEVLSPLERVCQVVPGLCQDTGQDSVGKIGAVF